MAFVRRIDSAISTVTCIKLDARLGQAYLSVYVWTAVRPSKHTTQRQIRDPKAFLTPHSIRTLLSLTLVAAYLYSLFEVDGPSAQSGARSSAITDDSFACKGLEITL